MIFAMTDVPGLMTHPPDHPESKLITEWHPGDRSDGLKHNSEIDVTGGIVLKLEVSAKMTDFTDHIWILDGRQPQRILEAIFSNRTIGTHISKKK